MENERRKGAKEKENDGDLGVAVDDVEEEKVE